AADGGGRVQAAQRRPDRVTERVVKLEVAPVAQIHLAVAVEIGIEVLEEGAVRNRRNVVRPARHGCHDGSGREVQIQEGRDADLSGRPAGLARAQAEGEVPRRRVGGGGRLRGGRDGVFEVPQAAGQRRG